MKVAFSWMKNMLFCTQFSPQNASNHILGLNFKIFWGSKPPDPPRKRETWLLVNTVGYSIQTCWLLQFYWNPCRTGISVEWYGCNWSYLWTSCFPFSEVRLYLMILEKLELYDKALDVLRKSNLASKCYWLTNIKKETTKVDGLNLVFQNVLLH